MTDSFLAIDWGTTNRRVYRIAAGRMIATERDDCGTLAMTGKDWAAEMVRIRQRHGDLPAIIAGMAGSNRGWKEAPYVPCPATVESLSAALLMVEPGRTAIVPGVTQDHPADVMRGEEVQILGARTAGLAPPDALLCQPGTHCKWARLSGGAIAAFTSAMTGELFGLVSRQSILAPQIAPSGIDRAIAVPGAAFAAGVRAARDRGLLAALFSVRAAFARGEPMPDAASYASGAVIGADVAAQGVGGKTVHILAGPDLGALYAAAIAELGGTGVTVDSQAAFVAGIVAIHQASGTIA